MSLVPVCFSFVLVFVLVISWSASFCDIPVLSDSKQVLTPVEKINVRNFTSKINFGLNYSQVFLQKLHFGSQDDPEMFMNASEIIKWNGFPCEVHYVETEDGYILGMQRIPQPSKKRLPVLLMHGLLSSSDSFLTNVVEESLAFILYNHGYDVWLGNVRGNSYSTKHVHLSPDQVNFWQWSYDEMGKYDIPAMVNYVLNHSDHVQLHYIGYSQGTTTLLAAAISQGEAFSSKINTFVALAPAAIVDHMKSVLRYLSHISRDVAFFFDLFGHGEFLPRDGLVHKLAILLCPDDPDICENVLFLVAGSDLSNANESRVPIYTAHNPAGTSVRNMLHWAQMYRSDGMKYFDYGHAISNWLHYGSIHPPSYNLSSFNIKTYAFCGGNDTLVVNEDCDHFLSLLPNLQRSYLIPSYNHLDFIWAIDVKSMVYDEVLRVLQ